MVTSLQTSMTLLLGLLTGVYHQHWNNHWGVRGASFYGDHQLFERLYSDVQVEIDTLAEKIVSNFGSDALSPVEQTRQAASYLESWERHSLDRVMRSLQAEEDLQQALKAIFDHLEDSENLSLGLNDFLAAVANLHETHLYLLRQRLTVSRVATQYALNKRDS